MTEPHNYAQWTYEDHLAKALELAAEADTKAEAKIRSEAERQRADVLQVAARADLHMKFYEAKKPAETRLAPKPQPRQQKSAGS